MFELLKSIKIIKICSPELVKNKLLKKDKKFEWNAQADLSFNVLKEKL
jgi:hypothetical protein